MAAKNNGIHFKCGTYPFKPRPIQLTLLLKSSIRLHAICGLCGRHTYSEEEKSQYMCYLCKKGR